MISKNAAAPKSAATKPIPIATPTKSFKQHAIKTPAKDRAQTIAQGFMFKIYVKEAF